MHGSITVTYDPSMGTNDRLAFDRALKAWRCATGVNFTTNSNWSNVGFGNDVFVKKGVITNTNPFGDILASTAVSLTQNNCNQTGQESAYQANFTLTFNEIYNWTTTPPSISDRYNIENIGLHELGHAHLLNHVNDPNALMYSTTNNVTRMLRYPSPEAINAGNHIMGISTIPRIGQNCLPPMVKLNSSNCNDLLNPVDNLQEKAKISMYPNPAHDFITIEIEVMQTTHCKVKIYDLLGKVIFTQPLNENRNRIDIEKFEHGTYILEVEQNNLFFRSKLIKI
jgi:Secretion system C-terminal sorting domain/Matrixin